MTRFLATLLPQRRCCSLVTLVKLDVDMAQVMLDMNPDLPQPSNSGDSDALKVKGRSKVILKLQNGYSLIVTRRRDEVFISIKKGSRNISVSEQFLQELCELKESIQLCCAFVRK